MPWQAINLGLVIVLVSLVKIGEGQDAGESKINDIVQQLVVCSHAYASCVCINIIIIIQTKFVAKIIIGSVRNF